MSSSDRASRRKDRLIQTRVRGSLESTLKEEARKRRLSVSHLIRNILEDSFHLVDNVVLEVDNIVHDSVGLATQLRRDAQKIASTARGRRGVAEGDAEIPPPVAEAPIVTPAPVPAAAAADLTHVYAWNPVVLNRPERCSKCVAPIEKGSEAFVGLSDDPTKPRAWMCGECADEL